jgi:hypothetical protein
VCKPVPELNQSCIYHDYPFDAMFRADGLNHSSHYDRTQMVRESVIVTMVNFAILLNGRVDHVNNVTGVDMLANFKFACLNFIKNQPLGVNAATSPHKQDRASSASEVPYVLPTQPGQHVEASWQAEQSKPARRTQPSGDIEASEPSVQRKYLYLLP